MQTHPRMPALFPLSGLFTADQVVSLFASLHNNGMMLVHTKAPAAPPAPVAPPAPLTAAPSAPVPFVSAPLANARSLKRSSAFVSAAQGDSGKSNAPAGKSDDKEWPISKRAKVVAPSQNIVVAPNWHDDEFALNAVVLFLGAFSRSWSLTRVQRVDAAGLHLYTGILSDLIYRFFDIDDSVSRVKIEAALCKLAGARIIKASEYASTVSPNMPIKDENAASRSKGLLPIMCRAAHFCPGDMAALAASLNVAKTTCRAYFKRIGLRARNAPLAGLINTVWTMPTREPPYYRYGASDDANDGKVTWSREKESEVFARAKRFLEATPVAVQESK